MVLRIIQLQIITITISNGQPTQLEQITYGGHYKYNGLSTRKPSGIYSYNPDGQLVMNALGGTYTYDDLNQLANYANKYVHGKAQVQNSYQYGPNGLLWTETTNVSKPGGKIIAGKQVLFNYSASGQLLGQHQNGNHVVYIPGLANVIKPVGKMTTVTELYPTRQGNVAFAVHGKTIDTYVYTPYGYQTDLNHLGNTTQSLNITTQNNIGYTGQSKDPSTGDMQLGGFREYSTIKGSFNQVDTHNAFSNPAVLNSTAYVQGNPVFYSDPTGHNAVTTAEGDAENGWDWSFHQGSLNRKIGMGFAWGIGIIAIVGGISYGVYRAVKCCRGTQDAEAQEDGVDPGIKADALVVLEAKADDYDAKLERFNAKYAANGEHKLKRDQIPGVLDKLESGLSAAVDGDGDGDGDDDADHSESAMVRPPTTTVANFGAAAAASSSATGDEQQHLLGDTGSPREGGAYGSDAPVEASSAGIDNTEKLRRLGLMREAFAARDDADVESNRASGHGAEERAQYDDDI